MTVRELLEQLRAAHHWTFLTVFSCFGAAFWLVMLVAARREAKRRRALPRCEEGRT